MNPKYDFERAFGEEGQNTLLKNVVRSKRRRHEGICKKEENGKFKFNPDVPFDSKNDHGVYSKNNGNFPFALRPYKYMLLRQGRTAKADVMLLELTEPDKWEVLPITKLNEDGDLLDPL